MSPILTTRMTNFRWTICTLLLFATMVMYMDRQVLSLTWNDFIVPELGWNDADYGRITGIFSITYACAMLFSGKVIEKLGSKRGYIVALAVCTIGALMHAFCGLITSHIITGVWSFSFDGAREELYKAGASGLIISTVSVYVFMTWRVVLAIGQAANFPLAVSIIAEYFPKKDRAFATAVFNSGACIGSLFAPLLIPVIAKHYGWEMAFIIVGSAGFVWMFFWLFTYKSPFKNENINPAEFSYIMQDESNINTASYHYEHEKPIGWFKCLTYKQTWAFAIGKFMTDGAWWFFLFWAPVYISDTYGHTTDSPMGMALIFTIYLLCMLSIIGGYLPTRLINKFMMTPHDARMRSMLLFALIQIIGITAVPLGAVSPWLLVIIIGIQGAAHQSWSANLFSMIGDYFPKRTISTVVGIGGFAGAASAYLLMRFSGILIAYADSLGRNFFFLEFSGKQAAYFIIFCILAFSYPIGWGIIRLLAMKDEEIRLSTTKQKTNNY